MFICVSKTTKTGFYKLSMLVAFFLLGYGHPVQAEEVPLRQQYAVSPLQWPKAITADDIAPKELSPLAKPEKQNKQWVELGQRLFHDPILSRDKRVSCASCHEKRLFFTDKRRQAIGIDMQIGKRNTPSIFAVDEWDSFFWDGRAKTIEEQAIMPIEDPLEMDLSIDVAVERLNSSEEYRELFEDAFSARGWFDNIIDSIDSWFGEQGDNHLNIPQHLVFSEHIEPKHLAAAIASFERTLEPPETKFSAFIRSAYENPKAAVSMLSDDELKGMHLYRTKAKCMTCHEGPLLSDNQFHVTGLHYYGRRFEDTGRYKHTGKVEDSGKFRTPSLLGLNKTGPWMHNGLFGSLRGIINLYNLGGARPKPRGHVKDDPLFPKTTTLLHKLELTSEEVSQLEAFLKTL